jgi:hypothetical protein
VASWAVLTEQVVWISSRATAFSVVCDACAQLTVTEGYGGVVVNGSLPLETVRGTLVCPQGHQLRIEREGR